MPITQKYKKWVHACRNYSLPKLARLFETHCIVWTDYFPSSLERQSFLSFLRSILEENHRSLCRTSGLIVVYS